MSPDRGRIQPIEMVGISMAPWLLPGDLLLVDRQVPVERLQLGDIVVLREGKGGDRTVHRIVQKAPPESKFPFFTKGDRNGVWDEASPAWSYEGRVVQRFRNERWTPIRFRNLHWALSVLGLYPGQRLPYWFSRTYVRKKLGKNSQSRERAD